MDDFGEILGTIFGERIFGGREERDEPQEAPIVYERYLCGGPKDLNINDR
jgi:hypothetical protein